MMSIIMILLVIGLFLWLKEKNVRHEGRAVQEEEKHNIVRPLSNAEIENQYFNMRTDIYLKKNFPTMISWEWEKGSRDCLHYCSPSNGVNLVHKDGTKQFVLLWTDKIWGVENASQNKGDDSKKGETTPEPTPKKEDATEKVTEYLKENASKIDATVKSAMEKGCGFIVNFEVSKKIATEEFMKNLVQELERNTEYEVSFKDNVLEINFQNAMM